ncbi:hypothetical protein F4801DRAFT_218465 [Xylaria longipes]|nr:hypothetical protein F4801DRAFT_218465 [Xylaria longipes]RYC54680.1 hypothetical protein CHU98_g11526 [Xylaria longipes]
MADRAPPQNLRPGASRLTRAATSTAGVRRNLFQSNLTRRPTPTENSRSAGGGGGTTSTAPTTTTATNSSSSNSVDMLRFESDVLSESSEIVIRDKNGEFEVGDPPTPPLDDPDEEAALDDAQENERERQKLAAAVRQHQMTRLPVHPEEVLEALKASMRAKVAALAEDNWMYEAEEPPRVH